MAFAQLGELRSLVPSDTPICCLTATATAKTKQNVYKILGLSKKSVHDVYVSPNRDNIKLVMTKVSHDAATQFSIFNSLIADIEKFGASADRTIIYCRSIIDCAKIYRHFHKILGESAFVPNQPHSGINRFVAMYHSSTPDRIKTHVLDSLLDPQGTVRLVIATTALSMGVNFPNVRTVVQYGPSKDVEEYLQQIGRAGRDGNPSEAIMYWSPRLIVHCDNSLKDIVKGDACIRTSLLKHFQTSPPVKHEPEHDCCSVCHAMCKCSGEECCQPRESHEDVPVSYVPQTRTVAEEDLQTLEEALNEAKQCFSSQPFVYSDNMSVNFSEKLVSETVKQAEYIFSLDYIVKNLPVFRPEHALAVLDAVQETFEDFTVSESDRHMQLSLYEDLLTVDAEEFYSQTECNIVDESDILDASDEFL